MTVEGKGKKKYESRLTGQKLRWMEQKIQRNMLMKLKKEVSTSTANRTRKE